MREKDEEGYAIRPNRTLKKKEIASLRSLAELMVDLPLGKFEKLNLNEELKSAVLAARKMKKGAVQRQLRFIVGVLNNYEDDEVLKIQRQYELMILPEKKENNVLHQLEAWRDQLIEGDEDLLNKLVDEHQGDRQYLRQLVRNIAKEKKTMQVKQDKPLEPGDKERMPKSARVLFKYLQEIMIASAG